MIPSVASSSTRAVLVLLPGLMCDAENWAAQRTALAPQVDDVHLPAYGALDSLGAMAEHVLATAPPGRLHVAGHSMGGRIALEMARLAPQRIDRLALLDTGYQPLPPGEAGHQEEAGRHRLLALAQASGMESMAREWARGMVHPRRVDSPVFERVVAMIARSTPERFAAQIRSLLGRPDATPVLAALRCPTLLLCGRQDLWSPLARHEQMQALVPQARLEVIEDAGHMTTMEQPEAVTAALSVWLDAPSDRVDAEGGSEGVAGGPGS